MICPHTLGFCVTNTAFGTLAVVFTAGRILRLGFNTSWMSSLLFSSWPQA
jgi:hypothetical protein